MLYMLEIYRCLNNHYMFSKSETQFLICMLLICINIRCLYEWFHYHINRGACWLSGVVRFPLSGRSQPSHRQKRTSERCKIWKDGPSERNAAQMEDHCMLMDPQLKRPPSPHNS